MYEREPPSRKAFNYKYQWFISHASAQLVCLKSITYA